LYLDRPRRRRIDDSTRGRREHAPSALHVCLRREQNEKRECERQSSEQKHDGIVAELPAALTARRTDEIVAGMVVEIALLKAKAGAAPIII
jgi:hypothetical protein